MFIWVLILPLHIPWWRVSKVRLNRTLYFFSCSYFFCYRCLGSCQYEHTHTSEHFEYEIQFLSYCAKMFMHSHIPFAYNYHCRQVWSFQNFVYRIWLYWPCILLKVIFDIVVDFEWNWANAIKDGMKFLSGYWTPLKGYLRIHANKFDKG